MKPFIIFFHCLSVALASLLLASSVSAQDPNQNANRDVLVRTLGWGFGQKNLFYLTGGEYQALSVSESTLSGYHPYSGSRKFQVFRKVIEPETGAESYLPVAEASLLDGTKVQMLVFFRSSGNGGTVRIFAYDDSLEQLGEQAVFIGNFSPLDLAFQLNGEERFGLKPGESRVIQQNGIRHTVFQIAAFRGGQWEVEHNTSHRLHRGYRNYFFFRDLKDGSSTHGKINPIVYKESVIRANQAIESPDGKSQTGEMKGNTYESY